MIDWEKVTPVSALLIIALAMWTWISRRITEDNRRAHRRHDHALHLMAVEIAELRNDMTLVMLKKDMPEAEVLLDRTKSMRDTIEKLKEQLSDRSV